MTKYIKFAVMSFLAVGLISATEKSLAQRPNSEFYLPLEVISEPSTGLDGGSGFDDAPLVGSGVYGGIINVGEYKLFKVNLKKGQKVSALLNIKRETAITGEGTVAKNCAAMVPTIKIYDYALFTVAEETASWNAMGMKTGDERPSAPLAGDDTEINSYKIKFNTAEAGDYFVSVVNNWSGDCVCMPPGCGWANLNSIYEKARSDQKKYPKAIYNVKISVEESKDSELTNLEGQKIEMGDVGVDRNWLSAYSQKEKVIVSDKNYSDDNFDEEKSNNSLIKNILFGFAAIIFLVGVVLALSTRYFIDKKILIAIIIGIIVFVGGIILSSLGVFEKRGDDLMVNDNQERSSNSESNYSDLSDDELLNMGLPPRARLVKDISLVSPNSHAQAISIPIEKEIEFDLWGTPFYLGWQGKDEKNGQMIYEFYSKGQNTDSWTQIVKIVRNIGGLQSFDEIVNNFIKDIYRSGAEGMAMRYWKSNEKEYKDRPFLFFALASEKMAEINITKAFQYSGDPILITRGIRVRGVDKEDVKRKAEKKIDDQIRREYDYGFIEFKFPFPWEK